MEPANNSLLVTLTVGQMLELIRFGVKEALQEVQPVEEVSQLLTRVEASERLHVSLATLSRYIKSGIVKGNKIGSRVLIREDELNEALISMKRNKHD